MPTEQANPNPEPETTPLEPEANQEEEVVTPTLPPEEDPRDAQILDLEAQVADLKDQFLRAVAEGQTTRRRLREQFDQEKRFAAEPLVRDLLPVLDNLERTLASAERGVSLEKLVQGVTAVDRQLRKALKGAGVERIEASGGTFDPALHEALEVVPTEEHPENTILTEVEAGYRLHERVVRPARVRVAQKP